MRASGNPFHVWFPGPHGKGGTMVQKNSNRSRAKRGKWIFSISFHLPSFILYTVFLILPMFASLYFSVLKWDGITTAKFVGVKNFVDLFTNDRYFIKVILNTVKSMAAGVCIQLPPGSRTGLSCLPYDARLSFFSVRLFCTGCHIRYRNRSHVFSVF